MNLVCGAPSLVVPPRGLDEAILVTFRKRYLHLTPQVSDQYYSKEISSAQSTMIIEGNKIQWGRTRRNKDSRNSPTNNSCIGAIVQMGKKIIVSQVLKKKD